MFIVQDSSGKDEDMKHQAALVKLKTALQIQNIPSDVGPLRSSFLSSFKMAYHVQAPPTTGAMSPGVSVFVLPIEARPPLCLHDPRVN